MSEMKTFVFDLDGTLCDTLPEQVLGVPVLSSVRYEDAKPKWDMIDRVNSLRTHGHKIVIFTARGMKTFDGDAKKAEDHYRELTENWLGWHRVGYDELMFGKPSADHYVDDKGMNPSEFLKSKFE